MLAETAYAASKVELDNRVNAALERLYSQQSEAKALGDKAIAILVFPQMIKAGVALGLISALLHWPIDERPLARMSTA